VAESRADRAVVAEAAATVMIAMMPTQFGGLLEALELPRSLTDERRSRTSEPRTTSMAALTSRDP
jgi:hypothetical protein